MGTEVWFRNPHNYVRELAEVGQPYRVAWDRGILIKKHIDPHRHAQLYFGENTDWRVLAIGTQGAAELDPEHDMSNPKAVYPTWAFGENLDILEELMASNIGHDPNACTASVPVDERPVPNQEHRVVVTNLPNISQGANRAFYRELKTLAEDYPECILHIHGSYSFRVIFGQGYGSGDIEPRGDAANGRVILPNGKIVAYARTIATPQWVNVLGFSVIDLKDPRNRCMFNIKSAIWAGEHWDENIKFQSRGSTVVDSSSPISMVPTTASSRSKSAMTAEEGDKITCETCSLAPTCKYFRTGAVCSLPESETVTLAKMFNTRDSDQVIGALGALLGASSKRLERGMTEEDEFGELDPEVTKLMNQLFNNGVKYAKLIDPSLTKPGVQVNIGGNGVPAGASSRQLTSAVVQVLERQGVKREDITPEMVTDTLRAMGMEEEQPKLIVQGPTE